MAEKGTISPVVRRLITMVMLLGISGAFIAFYYLAYLPHQQANFNQRMFRVLHEMANNFSTRAENFGQVSSNSYVNRNFRDNAVSFRDLLAGNFNSATHNSFKVNLDSIELIHSRPQFKHDSINFEILKGPVLVDSTRKALSDILEPLISIHASTFESILLVKLTSDQDKTATGDKGKYDAILYRSSKLDIANINTDSLFPNRKIQAATLSEIDIEGVTYKIFLMPFHMKLASGETFVLSGIISKNAYNRESQYIPINFLIAVIFILVFILLCLPFLKVFILSVHENIVISDVRFMIASIFIIPLVMILFASVAWLHIYPDRFTDRILNSLQDEIKANFYKEINQTIIQEKEYDSILSDPEKIIRTRYTSGSADFLQDSGLNKIRGIDSFDMKDLIFYPAHYRNTENLHWMDSVGKDIAMWRFTKDSATYFNLKDRQYFKDILYKKGYIHPTSKDTFTIQATLSRLTGEYTLNVVTPSNVRILPGKKSIATGISSRMYSVYNTVVPSGFGYCLVDQDGEMVFSSDTARSLQENLLAETDYNHFVKNAIAHKDVAHIDNVHLYDESVTMIIKPLEVLPYYLVTYYNKRSEYLFLIHIEAFVFLSMSLLLLFVSLFSYCLMMINKKITKLLYVPGMLNWLKPSSEKKDYYIRNCIQQISMLLFIFVFSIFLSRGQRQLYMLNYALLLPLWSVTGYYIIKKAKTSIELYKSTGQQPELILMTDMKQAISFLYKIKEVLLLYVVSLIIFAQFQENFIYRNHGSDGFAVKNIVWSIIVLFPILMCLTAHINVNYLRNVIDKAAEKFSYFTEGNEKRIHLHINFLTAYMISLLLSVLLISVIPAITFTRYALNEERMLHFQTYQLELAKKIQERRTGLNLKLWETKLNMFPEAARSYVDSLKFSPEKGLYLGGLYLDTVKNFENNMVPRVSAARQSSRTTSHPADAEPIAFSPFYKILTQFLFLPPDHDEFYDNVHNHQFYYWEKIRDAADSRDEADRLYLYYKNLTDHKNPVSVILSGALPGFNLFEGNTPIPAVLLILSAIAIFVILFYKILRSVSKRIFMIGYFEDHKTSVYKDHPETNKDTEWLIQKYPLIKWIDLYNTSCFALIPHSFAEIRKRENQLISDGEDECVLKIHLSLSTVYENMWKDCTDDEKFTMYDFALDGFTNHKKIITLLQLYQKGLLIKEDDNLHLVTRSFRNFILTKDTAEVIKVMSDQGKGSWATLRTVFYIVILIVAIFIFLSQEEASKRLITIVTSLGALLPALLKLFDKSSVSTGTNKSGP